MSGGDVGGGGVVLTEADRRVIRETVDEVQGSPPPTVIARYGIPSALLGGLLLFAWPRVSGSVPGGDFVSPFITLFAVVLLLGGPALVFLGAGGGGRAAAAAVEAALDRFRDPESDGETLLRAATLLILHAYARRGPATVEVFDAVEVQSTLGGHLGLVRAVERYLVDEGKAYPAFTLASDRAP
ncbi:MAG: hypothetical protein KJO65_11155 [Gemmatimonadetes bacterium]|nr:hypothetical protein [Gemmatimonadota bacterium]